MASRSSAAPFRSLRLAMRFRHPVSKFDCESSAHCYKRAMPHVLIYRLRFCARYRIAELHPASASEGLRNANRPQLVVRTTVGRGNGIYGSASGLEASIVQTNPARDQRLTSKFYPATPVIESDPR